MKQHVVARMMHASAVGLALALCAPVAAQTNATSDVDWSRHIVEAYKDYQQQQVQTLKALQQTRDDLAAANAAAEKANQETAARLKLIEESLAAQRERDRALENLQQAHRQSLLILVSVAGCAFFILLLFALYLLRVLSRRAEVLASPATMMSASLLHPALPSGETALATTTLNPAEQSTARFLAAIERLEKRLAEMESLGTGNGNGYTPAPVVAEDSPKQLAVLLGKGQTLLNLGKPAEALVCFDDAIKLDAGNAEAHVKRGTALEKLERLDDAIASYDHAIQLDNSLTMAYLCKGGVFNRLERYSDALRCYEQALQSQEKPVTPA